MTSLSTAIKNVVTKHSPKGKSRHKLAIVNYWGQVPENRDGPWQIGTVGVQAKTLFQSNLFYKAIVQIRTWIETVKHVAL